MMDKYAVCDDDCPDEPHAHLNLMTGAMYPSEVSPEMNVWLAPSITIDYDPTLRSRDKTITEYIQDD